MVSAKLVAEGKVGPNILCLQGEPDKVAFCIRCGAFGAGCCETLLGLAKQNQTKEAEQQPSQQ